MTDEDIVECLVTNILKCQHVLAILIHDWDMKDVKRKF